MTKLFSTTLFILLLTCAKTFAGGDEVIVIYNSRVPESKAVAEYYAAKRAVPSNQIFGFNLTTNADMSRAEFRDVLQKPLARELEKRKLWRIGSRKVAATNGVPARVEERVVESKIRYAVICYGVPFRISPDGSLKEKIDETMRQEFRLNQAGVDSELSCLPLIEENLPLTGPILSAVYGMTNEATIGPVSGVLLVSRIDGPSPEIARGLVDKAIQAEAEGMWGRAYFDARSITNPIMKMGDDYVGGAAAACRLLGFETILDTNEATFSASFPMSQIGFYCGWYDQRVSGPFTLPQVEFMPGAFAYHLFSYSARDIHNANADWVGTFLSKGATISMGVVDEPYLLATPNLTIFAERLIYGRFNFAAAAYASQPWLSWQTMMVGDPLYRPFGKAPETLHAELESKRSKLTEWSYLRLINLNLAARKPVSQLVALLEQIPNTRESAVLTEKYGDLLSAQGKPSSSIDAYQRALGLAPSRQQRIRLRLTLGEKLVAVGRKDEAAVNYQKLLDESPDYPGKSFVLEKLAALKPKIEGTNAPVGP